MIDLKRYISIDFSCHYDQIDSIENNRISMVVPTRGPKERLNRLLNSCRKHFLSTSPAEVIIVDNNPRPLYSAGDFSLPNTPVRVLHCSKAGAAAARNLGASIATGSWILFCDDDCILTRTTIQGYIRPKPNAIAYAGSVNSFSSDWFSMYYELAGTLKAPESRYKSIYGPMYVVTANALVWKKAFDKVKGFNEKFRFAAEDVDLSLRLWKVGKINHAQESRVLHDFEASWNGFLKRFFRYGRGNRTIEDFYPVNKKPKKKRFGETTKNWSFMLGSWVEYVTLFFGYTYDKVTSKLPSGEDI